MTGRELMQRLRADPTLRARLESPQTMPLGAWPVLEAVADLMAASPEVGVLRDHPPSETRWRLARSVASHLFRFGPAGEAEVNYHLWQLTMAGLLIVRQDGVVAWPVDMRDAASEARARAHNAAEVSERVRRLFGGDPWRDA